MTSRIRRVLRSASDRGASAVEYGLMIAAITAVIVAVVFGFGQMINSTFTKTTNCIERGGQSGPPYPNCPGPQQP